VYGGRQVADELLHSDAGATALIILEEAVGSGVVAELTRQGRRIPDDISVMSILSSVDVAAVSNPPLTTVTVPSAELGRLGVAALLEQLNGKTEPSAVLRGGELRPGESTGPAPKRKRPGRRPAH
jgi:DNA-binding LacI/PurR family transcriptional regulator